MCSLEGIHFLFSFIFILSGLAWEHYMGGDVFSTRMTGVYNLI